jgi:hypothetical protein
MASSIAASLVQMDMLMEKVVVTQVVIANKPSSSSNIQKEPAGTQTGGFFMKPSA